MLDNEQLFNEREQRYNRTQVLQRLADSEVRSRAMLEPPLQLASPPARLPAPVPPLRPQSQKSRRRKQWTFLFSVRVTQSGTSRSSRKMESTFEKSFTIAQPSLSLHLPRRERKSNTPKSRKVSSAKRPITSSTSPPVRAIEKLQRTETKPISILAALEEQSVEVKPALSAPSAVEQATLEIESVPEATTVPNVVPEPQVTIATSAEQTAESRTASTQSSPAKQKASEEKTGSTHLSEEKKAPVKTQTGPIHSSPAKSVQPKSAPSKSASSKPAPPKPKPPQPKPPSEHQSYPALAATSRPGLACPLCRTPTVASRWRGHEKRLSWIGISARRCPRCLHRFYAEPLIFRPVRKLVEVTLWRNRAQKPRSRKKSN